jgi:predicted transcriptional regulator
MAQTVCVLLSASDRKRLEAIASDRNRPRKYIERAAVVLAAANHRPVQQVATETDVSRPMV